MRKFARIVPVSDKLFRCAVLVKKRISNLPININQNLIIIDNLNILRWDNPIQLKIQDQPSCGLVLKLHPSLKNVTGKKVTQDIVFPESLG